MGTDVRKPLRREHGLGHFVELRLIGWAKFLEDEYELIRSGRLALQHWHRTEIRYTE